MRRIPIANCKPGMILAKPIYNDIGAILINKEMELTEAIIFKLIKLGIETVLIHDSRTDDIVIEDALSDETKSLALKTIKNTFQEMFKEKLVHRPLTKGNLSLAFKPVLENMLIDLKSNKEAMLMLSTIYVKDLYLYTHSLNVALYAISMGMGKGYNQQQLQELGLGALLHDIGKTKIPIELIEKKEQFLPQEQEIYSQHARFGYDILRKEPGIPLLSAHIAFQHHEKLNGNGYPRGIQQPGIHEYAQIVAIADQYDKLLQRDVDGKKMLPHEVLDSLYARANTDFSLECLDLFKKTIAIYPLGTNVTLNSGECGVVVDINAKYPDRPIVRILEEQSDEQIASTYEIDLSKELAKSIVSCSSL